MQYHRSTLGYIVDIDLEVTEILTWRWNITNNLWQLQRRVLLVSCFSESSCLYLIPLSFTQLYYDNDHDKDGAWSMKVMILPSCKTTMTSWMTTIAVAGLQWRQPTPTTNDTHCCFVANYFILVVNQATIWSSLQISLRT